MAKEMRKIQYVDRKGFVEQRYESFKRKKAFFEKHQLTSYVHLTDLDKTYPEFGKPMKEVVLCDRCNQDILDEKFPMVEKELVYHPKCKGDNNVTALFR